MGPLDIKSTSRGREADLFGYFVYSGRQCAGEKRVVCYFIILFYFVTLSYCSAKDFLLINFLGFWG